MKVKEKLAEEYLLQVFSAEPDISYLAGFEKAREMAVETFEASLTKYQYYPFQEGWKAVARDLGQIGEEEVE